MEIFSPTWAALNAAALPSPRHRSVAANAAAILDLVPVFDRPILPVNRFALYRARALFRRAGIAPISDGTALARIGFDLGLTALNATARPDALARLIWFLNADRSRDLTSVRRRWGYEIAVASKALAGVRRQ
jgi:hypothetical protein